MLLLLASCSGADKDEAQENGAKLTWPTGKFLYVHENSGYYFEEWKKIDDLTYKGEGHFLTRDCIDTLFSMSLRLAKEKEKTTLYYAVKNQNDNKEIEFILTKADPNLHLYVFENPFRDFPSIMQYRMIGDTAMEVTERGFEDNKERIRQYLIRKIN
jgi:hypothetical protein